MKCNHCNADVADGTNFCPYCGNRIELPQALRCPQCNTELTDGVKFCPNCGSPVGHPQPKKCSQCGAELEEGERFCSNCGTPVGGSPQPQMAYNAQQAQQQYQNSNFSYSSLNLIWDCNRKQMVMNKPVVVYVNNQRSIEFSPKEPFEKKYTITSPVFNLQVEYGFGPFTKTDLQLNLAPNQSYICTIFLNAMGTCGYELKDSEGKLIKEDGNTQLWQIVLFLLVPLVGFIYFFIKKDSQPISAKAGLLMGFGNIAWILLRFLFF